MVFAGASRNLSAPIGYWLSERAAQRLQDTDRTPQTHDSGPGRESGVRRALMRRTRNTAMKAAAAGAGCNPRSP